VKKLLRLYIPNFFILLSLLWAAEIYWSYSRHLRLFHLMDIWLAAVLVFICCMIKHRPLKNVHPYYALLTYMVPVVVFLPSAFYVEIGTAGATSNTELAAVFFCTGFVLFETFWIGRRLKKKATA